MQRGGLCTPPAPSPCWQQHRHGSHWDRRALQSAAQWRSASLPNPIIPLNTQQCATGKCMKGREGTRLNSLLRADVSLLWFFTALEMSCAQMGLFTTMLFVAKGLGMGEGSGKNIQKLSLVRCHQPRMVASEKSFLVSEISISLLQGRDCEEK